MHRLLTLSILSAAALNAQSSERELRPGLATSLSFEGPRSGNMPYGWGGNPADTIFVDSSIVHGGKYSARIERTANSSGQFTNIGKALPVDFKGNTITLRGYIRTADVAGWAGLWLRLDGDSGMISLDNMSNQQLRGTNEWKQYSVTLRLTPEARQVVFGFLVHGAGTGWVDDMELLVDGKFLTEIAPDPDALGPSLPADHQFDRGSGLTLTTLSAVQIENLTLLGRIWGFLKYHHPNIAAGKMHWDYQLLRVLPSVLAATREDRNGVLLKFVQDAGPVAACDPCARLDQKDLHIRPALEWISDRRRLGEELSAALENVHRNRAQKQFFLTQVRGVRNPYFEHEPTYQNITFPDPGFQLLALYRYWNMVEYWFPYRDIIGESWPDVLARSIAPIMLAKSTDEYKIEMIRFIAAIHDTHANLWSSLAARPPHGDCELPVTLRFIESRPVVWAYRDDTAGPKSGLRRGDAILTMDGRAVDDIVKEWSPLYAASNDPTRLRDIARQMPLGTCGSVELRILRSGQSSRIVAERLKSSTLDHSLGRNHDLGGEPFRLLSPEVAYVRIGGLKKADVPRFTDMAKDTKGMVIDIRNYPIDFPIYDLGGRITARRSDFATFTVGDLANPGAFHFDHTTTIQPIAPHYTGKVAILVDESTQSSAEFHAMAFRATGGVVVGSTTAAADGNVSRISLPGGLSSMFSGIGVFYPDRKPTQRVGIIPDVIARPTIAGVAAGHDEVLEAALRVILGAGVSGADLHRLTKRLNPE